MGINSIIKILFFKFSLLISLYSYSQKYFTNIDSISENRNEKSSYSLKDDNGNLLILKFDTIKGHIKFVINFTPLGKKTDTLLEYFPINNSDYPAYNPFWNASIINEKLICLLDYQGTIFIYKKNQNNIWSSENTIYLEQGAFWKSKNSEINNVKEYKVGLIDFSKRIDSVYRRTYFTKPNLIYIEDNGFYIKEIEVNDEGTIINKCDSSFERKTYLIPYMPSNSKKDYDLKLKVKEDSVFIIYNNENIFKTCQQGKTSIHKWLVNRINDNFICLINDFEKKIILLRKNKIGKWDNYLTDVSNLLIPFNQNLIDIDNENNKKIIKDNKTNIMDIELLFIDPYIEYRSLPLYLKNTDIQSQLIIKSGEFNLRQFNIYSSGVIEDNNYTLIKFKNKVKNNPNIDKK